MMLLLQNCERIKLEVLLINKKKKLKMNSIYTTSLRTQQSEHHQNNESQNQQINISQSYKDLLFSHIINIKSLHDKQNTQRSSIQQTKKNKNNYSKIAEKMILSQINPNLGTLAQFMSEKSENRLIYTSKKKRHQQVSEQNVIKRKILQKNNQQVILKSNQTSVYQKKIASKVFVQRIFNDIFNTPVQQFVSKNTIKSPKKSQMLNLSTLESLLTNNYANLNDNKLKRYETKQSQNSLYSLNEKKKNRVVHISYDPQTKLKKINELKSNYYDLRKIQIPKQNKDFSLLIHAQNELEKYLKQISQNINFSKRNSTLLTSARNSLIDGKAIPRMQSVNIEKQMLEVSQKFRTSKLKSVIYPDTIAKVTQEEVVFKKMGFKDLQMGLYMISCLHLQKISIIRLQNVTIEPNILFLFLDVLCKFAPQINPLKQISICSVSIQNLNRFTQKIAQLLKQLNVKRLCLNYTDIGSKQFTKLCVGIAQNECLEQIQLRNNRIDYLAVKPLQTMLRICHNIKTIDLRNNQIANYPNLKHKDDRIIV